MNKLCCAALLCLPLTATAAYQIEVDPSMNGAEVSYDTQELAADTGAIFLSNHGLSSAICNATFRAGPDTPKNRRVLIKAGETATLTARFPRDIIRLRIRLVCGLE